MEKIKRLLEEREQLNFEMIEETSSKRITSIYNDIQLIENEIEIITGKTIEEIEHEYFRSKN